VIRRSAHCAGSIAAWLAAASPAFAHGFGQRYDLPIPLSHYLWGAGATVAFSFAVFAIFLKADRLDRPVALRLLPSAGCPAGMVVAAHIAKCAGAAILLLIAVAGLFGNQNPFKNLAPVMVWIIGWVGLVFLSSVLGDVWTLANPWDSLYRAAEDVYRRAGRGELGLGWSYPPWLGVWPAFVLFIAFAWMELVWSGRSVPASLATALLLYSAAAFGGMFVFGREAWRQSGEVFTLVFGIFARFAPIVWPRKPGDHVEIRLPASGLVDDRPLHLSMVVLTVALLATVTFDGFLETPLWARLDAAILDAPADSFLWTVLELREDQALRVLRSIGLAAAILLFVAGYFAVCWTMSILAADERMNTFGLARRFVLTLVPIALAYHIAHYFSYLLVGGQYAIPLLSDPFGWGWDLIGTASYQVDIGVVGPRLQWYVAVTSVVLGHIIAVCLSHMVALRVFPARRAALVTQIPMIILMVTYTMCSLWILSQPIVESAGG
jgi:hypothetical protein